MIRERKRNRMRKPRSQEVYVRLSFMMREREKAVVRCHGNSLITCYLPYWFIAPNCYAGGRKEGTEGGREGMKKAGRLHWPSSTSLSPSLPPSVVVVVLVVVVVADSV